jgi:excisionase family DNA binding protein
VQEYLTVADVAALLKLSEKTVYRLAQRGELPGFKAGGSWRFRRRDIDAWAAALVGRQKGGNR